MVSVMYKPIRILHVLQRMEAGGTQALLMNIYRNIDRDKIQFDFLVEYDDKEFYDDEIISLGGKIYYTNFRRSKNVFKFEKTLKNIITENKYKIIHVHTYSIGYFVLKTAKSCGVPIRIAHSHSNNMTNDYKKYLKKIMQKLYLIYATDFIACSKEAGEYLFKNKDFLILNNSIDTEKFKYNKYNRTKIRKNLKINDNFVVGHVGRFRPEKNHIFLLEVFNEIKKTKENVKLLLVGNGDPNNLILAKINELKLENDVIILTNRKDVNEIYQAMDLFIFPSIYEGLGIVAIEAQTSGLPVLTSTGLPKSVEITNNIKRVPLDYGIVKWAELAIALYDCNDRIDMTDYIKKAGFDIKVEAQEMEDYYLRKNKGAVKEND